MSSGASRHEGGPARCARRHGAHEPALTAIGVGRRPAAGPVPEERVLRGDTRAPASGCRALTTGPVLTCRHAALADHHSGRARRGRRHHVARGRRDVQPHRAARGGP
ncbi:hypothetical protein CH313_01940 [Streptomyces sp. TSRI0384-2]|nr:hypothetical protein CH313_01940 [Streptomyces sp. TSRI0384-2]